MVGSLSILSCMVIIQGAYGTIFPPVSNDPPRPGQSVRGLSPTQSFNSPEDLPQEERYFPDDTKTNEERWYYGISPSGEGKDEETSRDVFDTYYQNGAPSISHVATPKPDVPSFERTRFEPSDRLYDYDDLTLARNTEGRYSSTRWIEVQPIDGRVVEEVDPNSGASTDAVKSVVAPIPFNIPPKSQISPNAAVNIVQVRLPSVFRLQAAYPSSPTIAKSVPAVKQAVDTLPPPNVKTVSQQDIVTDIQSVGFPPPSSVKIPPQKTFVVPQPPPPPIKGVDIPPKVISSGPVNIVPDTNIVISNKNFISDSNIVPEKSLLQQVRHVWIPTSSKTGKFITIPISGSMKSEKPAVNKGFSLESTPVTVSDTWILKQDGPVPIFQQQKSSTVPIPSPIVQSGKVIFQNPTIVQVDGPAKPIVTRIDSLKNAPIVEKSGLADPSRDLWPTRKEITGRVNEFPLPIIIDTPSANFKSDAIVIENPVAEPVTLPQKSIIAETKSALVPEISPKNVQIVNGKPCPFPLTDPQKSVVPSIKGGIISLPRIVSNQRKLPVSRIIRVNRYPMGNYYLLNRNIRPSYFIYPNQAIIQQPNPRIINLIQAKSLPSYFGRNIPLPPFQTKQISIPVLQPSRITSALSLKQASYPFVSRQVILPVASPKQTRAILPAAQPVRYAYPWNAYLKSSPFFNKGTYISELSPFKVGTLGSESDSSSSESSSEESSEKSKKKKEEKSKKEKAKKEEKQKSEENSKSTESEKESEAESKSKSLETESEEKTAEKESKESLETSESQVSSSVHSKSAELAASEESTLDKSK